MMMFEIVINTPFSKLFVLLLVVGLAPVRLSAQESGQMQNPEPISSPEEVSDEELQRFAISSDRIGDVQQTAREEIIAAVEESGLGMERFSELAASFNDPSMTLENEITQEEEAILNQLEPQMVKIELDAREQVFVQLAQEGLDVGRYQQIFHALQNFPSLQDRMNRVVEQDEQP
ncbi:MAG: DUF4168 domain-containing protein [Balneolaceae bacterium]